MNGLFNYLKFTKKEKVNFPWKAHLEITKKCNFKCVHCQSTFCLPEKEMTFSEICSVLDQLADNGTFLLMISGGEPMIRRDFWKIMEYAKKREFLIQLNSNASLITEDSARRLADLFLYKVIISIYGISENTHRSITGVSGILPKVLKNIEMLIKHKIRVSLRSPILKQNIKEFGGIVNFAEKLGLDFKPLFEIHSRFDGCKVPLKFIPSEKELKNLLSSFPVFAKSLSVYGPTSDEGVCPGGVDIVAISSFGEVMPCVLLRNKTNVRKAPISEIIRKDPFFVRIKKLAWGDFPACLECRAFLYCVNCVGSYILETDSLIRTPSRSVCKIAWLRKTVNEKGLSN